MLLSASPFLVGKVRNLCRNAKTCIPILGVYHATTLLVFAPATARALIIWIDFAASQLFRHGHVINGRYRGESV